LESAGLVTEEICLTDARKRVYTADGGPGRKAAGE
jgi:hypothetical protein